MCNIIPERGLQDNTTHDTRVLLYTTRIYELVFVLVNAWQSRGGVAIWHRYNTHRIVGVVSAFLLVGSCAACGVCILLLLHACGA